ncbi:MAG TPA: ABC transporter ATP-binding protein [Acidocella sp.]|nr:ABC transporter ATP-binding protein [Acidocella sp.]
MTSLNIDYRLLRPVSLHAQFEIHGFTALLGRSGVGKTSLLQALAGLLPATGTPWGGQPPETRPVGYLPQNAALFPHLTVLENTAYPLRGPKRFLQAQALLDELGLGDYAPRLATKLSGGEAQRVALARALAHGAKFLLLDEPSASLDATTRDATLAWLIAAISARAIPALAATHDPSLSALADWLVLLANGRIIQQGTPRAVFNAPCSPAAAELLGFENIWQENGAAYAIRATDIALADLGIPATLLTVREHGPDLRLECTAPQPLTLLVNSGDKSRFVPGARIFLHFPPDKLKRLG